MVFQAVETENFSSTVLNCRSLVDADHSSKCVCIAERRPAISEEHKLMEYFSLSLANK